MAEHVSDKTAAIGAVVYDVQDHLSPRRRAFIAVDDLAAVAGLSPRTFARRVERAVGLSPVRFLQRLRVERAVELLETTKLPLEEIARQVGYAEPSTLRRLIQRDGIGGPRRLGAAAFSWRSNKISGQTLRDRARYRDRSRALHRHR